MKLNMLAAELLLVNNGVWLRKSKGERSMFIITDNTRKNPSQYRVNDINTGADIILGITGEEQDYQEAAKIMGNMRFGDNHISDKYTINCVREGQNETY